MYIKRRPVKKLAPRGGLQGVTNQARDLQTHGDKGLMPKRDDG